MKRSVLLLGLLALFLAGCPTEETYTTVVTTPGETADVTADGKLAMPDGAAAVDSPDLTADGQDTDSPAGDDMPGDAGAALVGQPAPDFTLMDYDGNTHTLSEYTGQGKVVVLEWFEPDCGAVKAYYDKPEFVQSLNGGLTGEEVVWLSVNSAGEGKPGYGAEKNQEYATAINKTNPILEDASGQVGHQYGATVTPTVVVIGSDRRVVYFGKFDEAANPGEAGSGTNLVLAAVESAKAGEPPAQQSNEPFG